RVRGELDFDGWVGNRSSVGSHRRGTGDPNLLGACAAFLAGWWKNNLLLTIVVGMAVFFISRFLIGGF
ncbi:MAG: AzlD domain-containing protein, partial [bacterium]